MIQAAALEVLQPKRADQETNALRKVFARKRTTLTEGLKQLGIRCAQEPEGTFYTWASLISSPNLQRRRHLLPQGVGVSGRHGTGSVFRRQPRTPAHRKVPLPTVDALFLWAAHGQCRRGVGTDGKDAKIRPCKGVDALPARCAEEKSDAGTEVHPLARPLQFYSGGSLCPFSSRCHRMPFFSTSSRLSPDPRYPCSIITRLSCGVPHR